MALIDNIQSYYKLDESAGTDVTDEEDNNNGTNSGATIGETGALNDAYLFEEGDYVNVGTGLTTGQSALTISAWFKTTNSSTTTYGSILADNDSGPSTGYTLYLNSGKMNCFLSTSAGGTNTIGSTSIDDGDWHHVVMVYNGTDIRIYVDGSLDNTPALRTGNVIDRTSYIGYNLREKDSFLGTIDEVGVWNVEKSSDDVTDLYNSGTPLAYPFTTGSASASVSPSASTSASASTSPSASASPSSSSSASVSPSASASPSSSTSPSSSSSASASPSSSTSPSSSASASVSPSSSESSSASPSSSTSPSSSESSSQSPSSSESLSASPSSSISLSQSPSSSTSPSSSSSLSQSPSSSTSPSSSASASVSPSPSPGHADYTRGDYIALPGDETDLETDYTPQNVTDVSTIDGTRVDQTATGEFMIHQFKNFVGAETSVTVTSVSQSTQALSTSTAYLQIYNLNTTTWDAVDNDNTTAANTNFTLEGDIADLTNYKDDSNVITCRVYQEAV